MFSPSDFETETRMLKARDDAAFALAVQPVDENAVWGWRGRTVGCEVDAGEIRAWLRVISASAGKGRGKLWDGTVLASREIPTSVQRPKLIGYHDWSDAGHDYRAELTDFVASPVCSPDPWLRRELDLPREWWASLRTSLSAISQVDTDRETLRQEYLTRALPQYLEAPNLPTVPARWTTAHGDCHWANLTTDGPIMLDWEGWGRAPACYDAAMLATYAIPAPQTAKRLREELGCVLDTPAGRFAELTVLAELIQTTTRGDNLDMLPALRERARDLLRVGYADLAADQDARQQPIPES